MQNTIVSKRFGLVRHPHSVSGYMCVNGFCLECQKVHAAVIDEPLNPSNKELWHAPVGYSLPEPAGIRDPFTTKKIDTNEKPA